MHRACDADSEATRSARLLVSPRDSPASSSLAVLTGRESRLHVSSGGGFAAPETQLRRQVPAPIGVDSILSGSRGRTACESMDASDMSQHEERRVDGLMNSRVIAVSVDTQRQLLCLSPSITGFLLLLSPFARGTRISDRKTHADSCIENASKEAFAVLFERHLFLLPTTTAAAGEWHPFPLANTHRETRVNDRTDRRSGGSAPLAR